MGQDGSCGFDAVSCDLFAVHEQVEGGTYEGRHILLAIGTSDPGLSGVRFVPLEDIIAADGETSSLFDLDPYLTSAEQCEFHVAEEHRLRQQLDPHSRDYLFDESGNPRWTVFDREDLIPYREFAVRTFEDGHVFDLGGGYEVEAVLLPGHTPGQCGFLDRWNMFLLRFHSWRLATYPFPNGPAPTLMSQRQAPGC